MSPIQTLLIPIATASLTLAASPAAQAQDIIAYRFTQTGFADGAIVSGYFVGADHEADGTLLSFELDDFSFSFSGNRAVPAFTMGMENRAGLVFDIASGQLQHLAVTGPGETRALEYDAFGWPGFHIPGRVSDNELGLITISWERFELAPMAPVPEPHGAPMLAAGLLALAGLARRRLGRRGDRGGAT